MVRIMLCAALSLASLVFHPAYGHGLPKNIHGGLTATELDLGFEIYERKGRIWVYVTDHDHPFDTRLFDGHVEIGKKRFVLESRPNGQLVSKDVVGKPDLKTARLVLGAKVLPAPIRLSFSH